MALVFQEYSHSLMPWLTVGGNVALPLRGKGLKKAEIRERCGETLSAVGLGDVEQQYPWQLSGGMQQGVAFARALAYRPDVLLMDEPFASVDAQTRMELDDLVFPIRETFGVTVLSVTHDIDEAVYLADRVVVLGASPARVLDVIPVSLPHPRDQVQTKERHDFFEVRNRVLELVRGRGAGPSAAEAERSVSAAWASSPVPGLETS